MKRSSAIIVQRRSRQKRAVRFERLESRNLMYALPLGATGVDTASTCSARRCGSGAV